jgi:hypothetical protein
MTDTPNPPHDPDRRARRLADALRENLKRRKAQARGRADQGGQPSDGDADADAGTAQANSTDAS